MPRDPEQQQSGASPQMTIIKESGQVSVSDSNLTVAGGHANHIEFNITLGSQPSPDPQIPRKHASRSLWSTLLGKWQVGARVDPLPLPHAPPNLVPETQDHQQVEGHSSLLPRARRCDATVVGNTNDIEVVSAFYSSTQVLGVA
jgi:hypothetical protein